MLESTVYSLEHFRLELSRGPYANNSLHPAKLTSEFFIVLTLVLDGFDKHLLKVKDAATATHGPPRVFLGKPYGGPHCPYVVQGQLLTRLRFTPSLDASRVKPRAFNSS